MKGLSHFRSYLCQLNLSHLGKVRFSNRLHHRAKNDLKSFQHYYILGVGANSTKFTAK